MHLAKIISSKRRISISWGKSRLVSNQQSTDIGERLDLNDTKKVERQR